jgi:hypothetical protein
MEKNKKAKNAKSSKKNTKEGQDKTLNFMKSFAESLAIASILLLLIISFIIVGSQKRIKSLNDSWSKSYYDILSEAKFVDKGPDYFGNLSLKIEEKEHSSFEVKGKTDLITDYFVDNFLYNFIYVGNDFPLFPEEVFVYNRIIPELTKDLSGLFRDRQLFLFDLKNFSNIKVNSISVYEDSDYGYSIDFKLKEGLFSVSKNWDKWPRIENICHPNDYDCINSYEITIRDVLSEEEILSISDRFLDHYNICLSNYGEPEVQKNWLKAYSLSSDPESFNIPEIAYVNYPLKINDNLVYDLNGQKKGITVGVDMREKRASGLSNLFYHHYERSVYKTERNREVILSKLQNYSQAPSNNNLEDAIVFDIEVGTPVLAMMKIWGYNNDENIYVPAYIFPIISDNGAPYFYKENIAIPAVRDFFRKDEISSPEFLPAIID